MLKPMRYAAFLRGINLGKHNLIRMQDVQNLCVSVGFEQVRTHLQTGNIAFLTDLEETETIAQALESALEGAGLRGVAVMVRSAEEIQHLVQHNPFASHDPESTYRYLTLLRHAPTVPLEPFPSGDLEFVRLESGFALSVSPKPAARDVYPNTLIERRFKVPATTRFWNVIEDFCKMLEIE